VAASGTSRQLATVGSPPFLASKPSLMPSPSVSGFVGLVAKAI
jgi:hypothetical protein